MKIKLTIALLVVFAAVAYFRKPPVVVIEKESTPALTQTVATPVMAVEAAPVVEKQAALPPVDQVRELSTLLLPSDEQKAEFKKTLLNKSLIKEVKQALMQPTLLKKANFRERLKHLDVLYEGVKSKDLEIRQPYSQMAAELLAQKPKGLSLPEKKQFIGDRIEIALMLQKVDADLAKDIESSTAGRDSASHFYFDRAREMARIYQVSL